MGAEGGGVGVTSRRKREIIQLLELLIHNERFS